MVLSNELIFERLECLKLFDLWKSQTLTDEQLGCLDALGQRYLQGSPEDRNRLRGLARKDISFVFDLYAKVTATAAVRESNAQKVELALVAIAIKDIGVDFRDSLSLLALIYHSADKIGQDPIGLFRKIASISSIRISEFLAGFLKRTPEERAIATFGYKEGIDDQGHFTYVPK